MHLALGLESWDGAPLSFSQWWRMKSAMYTNQLDITQKCLKMVKWQKQKVIARYLSHAWSAHQKLLSFLTTDITCLLWSKLLFFFFWVSLIIMCLDTLKGIGDQRGCVNLLISACYRTLKSCCLLLTSNSLQYRKEKTKFIWKFFSLFKVIIGRLSFFFLESFFSLTFHQVVICLPRSFFFNLKKILTWKFTYMVHSIN